MRWRGRYDRSSNISYRFGDCIRDVEGYMTQPIQELNPREQNINVLSERITPLLVGTDSIIALESLGQVFCTIADQFNHHIEARELLMQMHASLGKPCGQVN